MKILVASLVLVVTVVTAFALVQITLDQNDVAAPVLISGLWVVGALGLVGLGVWCARDIQARRRRVEDGSQS